MKNITFLMTKNLFLEKNDQSSPRPAYVGHDLRMRAKACVCS